MARPKVLNSAGIDHILGRKDLTTSEKLVAVALLNHRNTKTLQCFPTRRTLAEEASMSRRWVDCCIAALVKKGVIVASRPERQKDGRLGRSRYAFTFDAREVVVNLQTGSIKPVDMALIERAAGVTVAQEKARQTARLAAQAVA
jgi:hypothetical protein